MYYTITIAGDADGIKITCVDNEDNDDSWDQTISASDLGAVNAEDEDAFVRQKVNEFLENTVELSYSNE